MFRKTHKTFEHALESFAIMIFAVCFGWVALSGMANNAIDYVANIASSKTIALVNTFFVPSIKTSDLQKKYVEATKPRNEKVKIMIVPGHEPQEGGTAYGAIYERDAVLDLAEHLRLFLSTSEHYEVITTRDHDGWNPELERYFKENWVDIIAWKDAHKDEMVRRVGDGSVRNIVGPPHGNAPTDMAIRLYGINKWMNDKDIDIAIHLHINDYPRAKNRVGEYNGYAIYVPERQYSNADASITLGDKVARRISMILATSSQPYEVKGLIEDQELIALGRYNTTKGATVLIEYGYIYETQFQNPRVRNNILKEYALLTYLGIQDYLGGKNDIREPATFLLPYTFKKTFDRKNADPVDTLALQRLMLDKGVYPPSGKTLRQCGLYGIFGDCTETALRNLQQQHRLTATGSVGIETVKLLNEIQIEAVQ